MQKTYTVLSFTLHFMPGRIFILLLSLGIYHSYSNAQTADIQPTSIDQPLSDTTKINALNTLARQWQDSTAQYEQAITYAKEALQLSENISYDSGIFIAAHILGNLYQKQAAYPQAQEHFNRALQIAEGAGNPRQVAKVLERIGYNYYTQGEFDTAIAQYFNALKITERLNAQKLTARLYTNLGNVYFARQDYQQQLKYAQLSLEVFEKMDDKEGLAFVYNNIANAHYYLENHEEALKNYLLSLEISQTAHDDRGVAVAYNNLGLFYYFRKEFDKALDYYRKGLQIKEKISDKQGMIYTLFNMGQLSSTQGKLPQAYDFLQQATKIAQEIGAKDRLVTCYRALADLYAKQENYQQAFEFHKQYTSLKDSLFNAEKNGKIAEMQARYESEKKDKEIELLNKGRALQASEIERKTMVQYASTGSLVLFSIIAYVLFRNFRQKRLLLHTQLIQEQKEAERLHELDRMKSNFFANIAHEFRTPLTLILGPAEQITTTATDQKSQQSAGLIRRNAGQLLKLIDQMLDLSRLESGAVVLEKSHQDIVPFIKGITMSFESLAGQKGIALGFHAEVASCFMDFDPDKLEKIGANLLSNAFKFTPQGGGITVDIDVLPSDGENTESIQIRVSDTGIGIPQDQIASVFDRFYQGGDANHRAIGSGIGLALTKELVELHEGVIQAQSSPDAGTTFLIMLPIKHKYQGQTPAKKSSIYPINAETDIGKTPAEKQAEIMTVPATDKEDEEIILVIEDNEDVRLFIRQSLEPHYKIIEASDGEAGLAVAQQHIPDLIISDVMMPQMDGYEVCSTLKQDEKTSHIPVILLTAKAGMESKLEGLETGADDYLAKPFRTKELLVRIRNLISIRKSIRTKYLKELQEQKPQPGQKSESGLAPREWRFLEKAKEAVKAELDNEDFGVEELSQALCMSRKNLHRKLKALTGQSPSLFIRVIRLQQSKMLLESGSYSVQEAAYRVGFNSATYFSTCFTEQYGYPPSTVRDETGME